MFTRRIALAIATAALSVLITSHTANAALVYSNGEVSTGNFAGGAPLNGIFPFEDFTLPTSARIAEVRFWTWDGGCGGVSCLSSFYWEVQGDNGGQPGFPTTPALASGVVARADVTSILAFTTTSNEVVYENRFSLGPVDLSPGTYWFGIHAGPLPSGTEPLDYQIMWAFQNYDSTRAGFKMFKLSETPGSWSNFGNELGLQFFGTAPEPGTLALLGLGLAGLAATRRRKQ